MVQAARAVNVPDAYIERNARLYLALRAMCDADGANAVALQDWPDMQDVYDISPLLALCWLAETDGIPSAHEGDVLGALTMRMLGGVSGKPTTMMESPSSTPTVRTGFCGTAAGRHTASLTRPA